MRPLAHPARYAPARCHPLVWRRAARDICFRSHALPRPSSGAPCRVAGPGMAFVRVSGARRRRRLRAVAAWCVVASAHARSANRVDGAHCDARAHGAAQSMFYDKQFFSADINSWDVSKVTNMQVRRRSV